MHQGQEESAAHNGCAHKGDISALNPCVEYHASKLSSVHFSVTEAARIFWHETQTRIPVQQEQRSSQRRRRFGRLLLPLVDELTGDVVHALSAKDLLRFLSKEVRVSRNVSIFGT